MRCVRTSTNISLTWPSIAGTSKLLQHTTRIWCVCMCVYVCVCVCMMCGGRWVRKEIEEKKKLLMFRVKNEREEVKKVSNEIK